MAFGPFPIPFKLDRTRNANAQAFDHLRELITSMTLVPGTQLDRAELQEYFGLSSTPVRDALTRLANEQLVDIYPKHATVVSAIDPDAVREMHFLRRAMEVEVAATLARQQDPAVIGNLQSLVSQQGLALSRRDADSFDRLDLAFHRAMYAAAQVEDLWHFLRAHSGNLDRLKRLHAPLADRAKAILADHASIVGAIAGGDPAAAQGSVREHLSATPLALESLRERYPGYFRRQA